MARRTVTIHYGGSSTTIGFFPGSSISSVSAAASAAFHEPSALLLRSAPSGPALSDNDCIPSAAWASMLPSTKTNSVAAASHPPPNPMQGGSSSDGLPDDPAFQGQYIKFERVLSHLASERTWLAWLRAAMTLLSVSFTLWELYGELSSDSHPVLKAVRY